MMMMTMMMMWRCVHTGHHSPRHGREDLHAISNVRYELRWRSLQSFCFFFFALVFLFLLTISRRRFLHLTSSLGSCRLCTIRNADCKFHTEITHDSSYHAFHETWAGRADVRVHTRIWGRRKWDFDLFWAKISSYSLVSFRSLVSFSQIRQWCLPLYGRYSTATHRESHCIVSVHLSTQNADLDVNTLTSVLFTLPSLLPVRLTSLFLYSHFSSDLFVPSSHFFLPAVAEPESQCLRELRQPQRHKGKRAARWRRLGFSPELGSLDISVVSEKAWRLCDQDLVEKDVMTWNQNVYILSEMWRRLTSAPPQPTPTSKFVQGYVGAVSSAVSIAVSLFPVPSDQC